MLKLATSFTVRVESFDVQPNNIIKMSTVFKLFQKAAGDDFDSTGMTYELLRSHGIVFVLTKNTVKFYDDIKKYDEITITTYPRGIHGVSFIRDYEITVNGKCVAYASSTWVIIDVNSRKLLRPNALDPIGKVPVDTDNIQEIQDKRIKFKVEDLDKIDIRTVRYSHIDYNGHMNNTFYPEIVFDYFDSEHKSSLKDKLISVYYISELYENQKFDIYTKYHDNEFMVLAKNIDTNKDVFTAIIDY